MFRVDFSEGVTVQVISTSVLAVQGPGTVMKIEGINTDILGIDLVSLKIFLPIVMVLLMAEKCVFLIATDPGSPDADF